MSSLSTYPEGYLARYRIEGCANNDTHPCYQDPNTDPGFQNRLQYFQTLLENLVAEGASKTFYKYGDGDYYFLKGISQGSATPGVRALSRGYHEIGHQQFVDGAQKCDYYTCELYPENRRHFKEVINREIDFPAEFSYGLVANKWLMKTFAGKIGIIGGAEKVARVQYLMQFSEYQEYLGLRAFNDYITIPERFACDRLHLTRLSVMEQLKNSNPETRIYLVGVGHLKSGLLHVLPEYKEAVYLDVGTGINMLAGVVNHDRPYAAAWTNFGSRKQSLDMDYMDFKEGRGVERWVD